MHYFVWLKTHSGKPSPELWYDEIPLDTLGKPKYPEHRILRKVEITEEETKYSLKALGELYPCPATTLPG